MALINCKECGNEVSDSAEFCPHCGYKYNHEEEPVTIVEYQQQNIVEQPVETVQPQQQNTVEQPVETVQPQQQNTVEQPVETVQPQQQNTVEQPIETVQLQTQEEGNSTTNQFRLNNLTKNKTKIAIIVIALIIFGVIAIFIFNKVQESKRPVRIDITMTEWDGYVDYILEELGLDFDLVTAGANCYTGVKKNEFNTQKYGVLHTEFSYCKSNERQVFRVYNDDNDQPLREPKPGELPIFDSYGKKIGSGHNNL